MVFWIIIKIGYQVYKAVLDTGTTLSMAACRLLKQAKIRKTKTAAIRVGNGRTFHSLSGVHVTSSLGGEEETQHCKVLDGDAFDIFIGVDFLRCYPEVKLLLLQRPYPVHCDSGSGLFTRHFPKVPSHLVAFWPAPDIHVHLGAIILPPMEHGFVQEVNLVLEGMVAREHDMIDQELQSIGRSMSSVTKWETL